MGRPQSTDNKNLQAIVESLKRFLHDSTYSPPNILSTNQELEANLRTFMDDRNLGCPELEKKLHTAASLIELSCPGYTLAEKTTMALFNWFMLYVDDKASKNPAPFVVFGQRFLNREQQLDPVLDALAEIILRFFDEYEIVVANYIQGSIFSFINSSCIEPMIDGEALVPGVLRFPWFLRSHTGASIAFGAMLITPSTGTIALDWVQALEDINFWTNAVNDILSFPKEELAGEKNTYIHNRARTESKTPVEVLDELRKEAYDSHISIQRVLTRVPGAFDRWSNFENGYIKWHLIQERYKLTDLDL